MLFARVFWLAVALQKRTGSDVEGSPFSMCPIARRLHPAAPFSVTCKSYQLALLLASQGHTAGPATCHGPPLPYAMSTTV